MSLTCHEEIGLVGRVGQIQSLPSRPSVDPFPFFKPSDLWPWPFARVWSWPCSSLKVKVDQDLSSKRGRWYLDPQSRTCSYLVLNSVDQPSNMCCQVCMRRCSWQPHKYMIHDQLRTVSLWSRSQHSIHTRCLTVDMNVRWMSVGLAYAKAPSCCCRPTC